MSVRAGAPKPDISTVEAFKRTLLGAKSIGYLKTGASGVYLAQLFERMGITQAIAGKVVRPDTDIVSEMVAKGEVELGLVVTTQILTTPGVELVGPIPSELQSYVEWDGIITVSSKSREATKALTDFLRTPKAAEVMKRQGMEVDRQHSP
jgi:molybdate transport system substrate-binding protein